MCDGNRKRSVSNQAFAQMPFLAMPEFLAARANFLGTQVVEREIIAV
jgi:hypothetical protein